MSSSEGYGRLFQAMPDGAALLEVVLDREGTPIDYVFLDVNAAYQSLFGPEATQQIGRRLSELPLGRPHLDRLAEVVTRGEAARYDVYVTEIDKHLRVSAFPTGEGRLTLLLRDATAERKAESERLRWLEERAQWQARAEWGEKVREKEALFRTTVENMPVNLILYDRDYRILYLNPALAAMCATFMGLSVSDIVGRYGREIWPEAVWNPLRAHTELAIASGQRETYELETVTPGRGLLVREWTVMPLRGADGEVQQVLAMSHDLTPQRRLLDELREADRRKSEFIAVLSHELRNPLAAMRSSLYILERGSPNLEIMARAREAIERQVQHLVSMVDDLLDVTRIARNKISLQRQALDLREVVRETIDDHRAHLADSGVRLETELAPDPIYIDADPARIAQVVTNLVSNAVKFTPRDGTAKVSVRVDAEKAVLRVTDSGIGIEPALLPRVFEPFMQADRTLDRTGGGLGLGLALVKGLVELHGGEVEARSEGAGLGAELVVRLPLGRAPGDERRAAPGPSRASGKRILVIEDDPEVREGLRVALELDDHHVEVAPDGPTGVEGARRFGPDVVLCDIGLPGMNGYEVARAFRADPVLRSTFLIALSGYAQTDDLTRAQAAGFDHHLAKPSTVPKIQEAIAAASPTAVTPRSRR